MRQTLIGAEDGRVFIITEMWEQYWTTFRL